MEKLEFGDILFKKSYTAEIITKLNPEKFPSPSSYMMKTYRPISVKDSV